MVNCIKCCWEVKLEEEKVDIDKHRSYWDPSKSFFLKVVK